MYCQYCGTQINDKSDYCPACGRTVYTVKNRRKKGSFLHVLLVLVVIICAATVYFAYSIDLYYNPDPCEIEADYFTKAILGEIDYGSDYQDTFLVVEDNYYTFFRAKDGRLTGCSADESGQTNEDGTRVIVQKTEKNYASLVFVNSDYTAKYVFRKASLVERLNFISLYF